MARHDQSMLGLASSPIHRWSNRFLVPRLGVALLLVATLAAVMPRPANATTGGIVHAVHGPQCPDVMVVAGRGAGGAPQGGGRRGGGLPGAPTHLGPVFGGARNKKGRCGGVAQWPPRL